MNSPDVRCGIKFNFSPSEKNQSVRSIKEVTKSALRMNMLALMHFWLFIPQVVLTLWYHGHHHHHDQDLTRAFLTAIKYVAAIQRGIFVVEPVFVLMMLDKI